MGNSIAISFARLHGVVCACRPVEVLRKESLAGLAPSAACRVLSHAYTAVVPITPLPYPPLPLSPNTPGMPHNLPYLRLLNPALPSNSCH